MLPTASRSRSFGLAAAAVASVGALGLAAVPGAQAAPSAATSTTASATTSTTVTRESAADVEARVRSAVAALAARPAVAKVPAVVARGAGDALGSQELTATDTVVDADGTSHVRLERTVAGLPVRGGDVVVHQGPDGGWLGASQTLASTLDLATEPRLSASGAAQRVLGATALTRGIADLARHGRPTLVVEAYGATPRLAWEVTTTGVREDQTPSRLTTAVDALDGSVLRSEEHVHTVEGEGESLYSGTVPLDVAPAGGAFELRDQGRGGTYTVDVGNRTDGALCSLLGTGCATGTVVSGPDTSFGDGTNGDRQSAAVDAQHGTDVTWDYYTEVHDRAGIFGDGSGSLNRVHYGRDYVNAFWDGEKMTFGDGDGDSYGPLVSLDVAGHEMTHGVTENTANLTYSGESGGLNEATSDIFGTMVEFYAANTDDPGDYLIGEEFDLASGEGLRRMDDPISDGSSPNCYSAQTEDLDVHYSSGVGNHFFYLLAEGSGARTINGVAHRSTTCDGSTLTGIGRDAAQRIWFRALSVYMTSGTDYAGARTATLQAASDLYGAGSAERSAVGAAWTAVGVG